MVELFGYRFPQEQAYVIAWFVLLLILVVIASKNPGIALGFSATILFAVLMAVTNNRGTVLNG